MPVKPDSRFASLSALQVIAPDGATRQVIALRIERPEVTGELTRYQVKQGETVDLLAQRFYGDEGLWWRILDANPEVIYPMDIKPGDMLNIPAPGPTTRITRARRF